MAKFSQAAPGPEQFWISLGATPDVMTVGWMTSSMSAPTTVQYGKTSGAYTNTASGNATFYKYSSKYTSGLIHHVSLTGLAPATVYCACGPACGLRGCPKLEAASHPHTHRCAHHTPQTTRWLALTLSTPSPPPQAWAQSSPTHLAPLQT